MALEVLRRMQKPTFLATFRRSLEEPLFNFLVAGLVLGLIINVTPSLILGEFDSPGDFIVALTLLVMILLVILGNHLWTLCSITLRRHGG
jgi:hypothetical protein